MSSCIGGCMGSIFKLLKFAVVIIVIYFAISFFKGKSSDELKGEYMHIKGTLEQININSIDFATLENQGSQSLNSLGAITSEWWDMGCAFAQNLYDKVVLLGEDSMSPFTPTGWPVNKSSVGSISSYGMRMHPLKMRFIKHKGVDLACATGTPICATADGVVEISTQGEEKRGYGQMILITHDGKYKSRYAHLSQRIVNAGQKVQKGQVIGYVGSSGGSTGAHLHYEVLKSNYAVNPMPYIKR